MRLLLAFLGAAALACVGWVFWRSTAASRGWREFLALHANTSRTITEEGRFIELAQRCFREPESAPTAVQKVLELESPEGRKRYLGFFTTLTGDPEFTLRVLDQEGRLLSSTGLSVGEHPMGLDFRPTSRRDLGSWTFVIRCDHLTGQINRHYALIEDRPVLVRTEDIRVSLKGTDWQK